MQTPGYAKKLAETGRKGSTDGSHEARSRKKRRAIAMTQRYNEFEHMQIDIRINGKQSRAMVDSGASGNFLATRYASYRNLPIRRKDVVYPLASVDGSAINDGWVKDEVTVHLSIQSYHENVTFDVIELANYDIILGIPWLRKNNPQIDWRKGELTFKDQQTIYPLHLLSSRDEDETKHTEVWEKTRRQMRRIARSNPDSLNSVWVKPLEQSINATQTKHESEEKDHEFPEEYKEYSELIKDEVETALSKHQPWDHEIRLEEGKKPTFGPIYQLSENELKVLKEYIETNLRKGFIRPSESPAGYPILFAPKKDGKLRLCVDYRQLNNITIKNRYALPLISELQERTNGAQIFSKIDLREGYHRIRMKEGEEWKTAFRTRYGHYEYQVMPFGLTNAPATMQALMNDILREFLDDFAIVYLDDILIYSRTEKEHIQHVKKVLGKLLNNRMLINQKKCEWHVKKVEFLGHIVTTEGIQMDPAKVKAILEWPEPKSVKEVQSFIGLANYYRKYIKGYSIGTAVLTDITKKDLGFHWNDATQTAFDQVKKKFAEEPILSNHDPELEGIVEADASDRGIGGVLSQKDPQGKLRAVAFYSRKLSPAEMNYEIHDKELLAIVECLKTWRVYLEGAKHQVQIYTDHKNLLYFTTTKVLNRRQVRWAEELSKYHFKIIYRKGGENGKADALSRRADYFDGQDRPSGAILNVKKDGMEYNKGYLMATQRVEKDDTLLKEIKDATGKDKVTKEWFEKQPEGITIHEGIIHFEGLVYVPTNLRQKVVEQHHDPRIYGHPGVGKTMEHVRRNYYFPGMRKSVEKHIAVCIECNQNKHARHKPYGDMRTPTIPERAWKSIALDFIVKLPKSKEPMTGAYYDAILVITDRLTKYCYFIAYNEASTAEDLAYMFLKTVVSQHGISEEIISDRDKLFKSKFWQSLMQQVGIHHKLSTAYHPQTDGQTERMNQTLEQYLRHYVDYRQTNWVMLLPIAQFAYNTTSTETTKVSPFYANYGYNPDMAKHGTTAIRAHRANMMVEQLVMLQKELAMDLRFIALRSKVYYDKRRSGEIDLKVGGKAFVLRRNMKTTRESNKLDHVKIGPFEVLRDIKGTSYELKLPASMKRKHPVFHVSLLEPAHPDTPETVIPEDYIQNEDEEEYEVEEILDKQLIDGEIHYLVKWENHEHSENTWEPLKHLKHSRALLNDYHRRNPDRKEERKDHPAKRQARGRKVRDRGGCQ